MTVDDIRATVLAAVNDSEKPLYRIALNARIAPETLNRFINGNRGMTIDTLTMVLDALGMEMIITKKPDGEGLAANDAGING